MRQSLLIVIAVVMLCIGIADVFAAAAYKAPVLFGVGVALLVAGVSVLILMPDSD